uniref:LOW QUALITY PROTEIN: protein phosphatase 2C 29-like n=1 Tax=Erigeron canadensis TaxID=72917 RepID=UPI001CB944F8|nr:LOW QUALITY PROTEIN: protein phosphatase 2C 29-like [Erigeron canadensis]
MGSGFSCFNPSTALSKRRSTTSPDLNFTGTGEQPPPLDETLGHSFCYVRSSARFISPTHSDRFLSPSQSLRFSQNQNGVVLETGFKAISGAYVSANSFTPRTVDIYDSATDTDNHNNNNINNITYSSSSSVKAGSNSVSVINGFESTSSFSALPLQPLPRGDSDSGRGGFFMSGPIERGALSGPLDSDLGHGGGSGGVPFSAPLNSGMYLKKKRRKGDGWDRKAFNRNFPRPWVVPVRNFVGGRKEGGGGGGGEGGEEGGLKDDRDVQWALGKAGEDRVHVVVSEEHGWLFVGIYDGFNGPDAPEFLMGNLYKAMYKELEGLFWDLDNTVQDQSQCQSHSQGDVRVQDQAQSCLQELQEKEIRDVVLVPENVVKKVSFRSGEEIVIRRRRLWEYLAEEEPEDGLDLSGSERFAFSVDDALSVSKNSSGVNRRSLLLSKLRNGFTKHKEGSKLFAWKFGLDTKEHKEAENRIEETGNVVKSVRKKKAGPVDHDLVLRAMSRALEVTEVAYLDMTDKVMDQYPELALMGSCLLAVLMRDEDVYVMNLGDSRAIVAQHQETEDPSQPQDSGIVDDSVVKESLDTVGKGNDTENEVADQDMRLTALQLSTDHSTSIEEEVIRIKNEHPDDNNCIVNDRVKGRLKVTRAFGAGSLKQAKWNDSLLEMFRNEYIGNAPYISCLPSLRHHKLCPRDQFLVLSSDGLYQYFTNQEVVSHVDNFMERFPDGDPAQHLIEELLLRAAKKAGMDLHELLDIPQGDRRKYHDDVTVMIISLEGRIWKSSGKYL